MTLDPHLLEIWQTHDHLPAELNAFIRESQDMVCVLDKELNYLAVNERACQILKKEKSELIGKNLLEVFPQLIASTSHRTLLQAISSGRVIERVISEGTFTRQGAQYSTDYYPRVQDGKTQAVLAVTKTLYYP